MDDIGEQFKKVNRTAKEKASRAIRKAIIATGDQIIQGAPVKTGRLRSNWQTTINTRSLTELPAGGIPKTSIGEFKLGDVCYLTNNLSYAQFIEYGDYEGQHRQGVVRQAIAEFQQKLDKYIKQESAE